MKTSTYGGVEQPWLSIAALVALALFALLGYLFLRFYTPTPAPTPTPTPTPIVSPTPSLESPFDKLRIASGFSISVLTKNVPGARAIVQDSFGNFWVSQTEKGTISQIDVKSGSTPMVNAVFRNLRKPHGLAFDPAGSGLMLYFAEENKISRVPLYSDGPVEKVIDLPAGGNHTTRTLGFGPDGRLYVSIGSTCNVCVEEDPKRATIYSLKPDGTDFKLAAKGLRNSVFFTWSFVDGRMWATDMGRDNLGDNLPPDEINIVRGPSASSGQNSVPNFGWPYCYGKNVRDTQFSNTGENPCREPAMTPSHIDLPAHVAPLGLEFIPEEGWPESHWYNLMVAYHGSWNSSTPVGYKVARVKLDDKGKFLGIEDFITGWFQGNEAWGRPVDILIQPGGTMYVTDDKAGAVYKVTMNREVGDKSHLIRVTTPLPNASISSPLTIKGEARGTWFFEADFPIFLIDANGNIVATAIAQAKGEWMTTDFVPFEATMTFTKPSTPTGRLVLKKNNPSGLPEHDDKFEIPIRFR